jgi:hypothetical protein
VRRQRQAGLPVTCARQARKYLLEAIDHEIALRPDDKLSWQTQQQLSFDTRVDLGACSAPLHLTPLGLDRCTLAAVLYQLVNGDPLESRCPAATTQRGRAAPRELRANKQIGK